MTVSYVASSSATSMSNVPSSFARSTGALSVSASGAAARASAYSVEDASSATRPRSVPEAE